MADESKDRRLSTDCRLNLADRLYFFLQENDAPEDLVEAYIFALNEYQDGKFSDLAEPFGIAQAKSKKNVIPAMLRNEEIVRIVDQFAAGWTTQNAKTGEVRTDPPLPKKPLVYGWTAFDAAAKLLNMTAQNVKKIYYEVRKK